MTKAELIELLKEWPDDANIYIASDEEGNSIHRLDAYGVFYTGDAQAYNIADGFTFGADDVDYIEELEREGVDISKLDKVLVLYP